MNSEGCSILPTLSIAFQNGSPSQSEWANQVWLHMRHVCLGIYHESATLLCGHSACMRCLGELFKTFGNESKCPVCRKPISKSARRDLKVNISLRSLVKQMFVSVRVASRPGRHIREDTTLLNLYHSGCSGSWKMAGWMYKRPSPPQRTCRPKNTG